MKEAGEGEEKGKKSGEDDRGHLGVNWRERQDAEHDVDSCQRMASSSAQRLPLPMMMMKRHPEARASLIMTYALPHQHNTAGTVTPLSLVTPLDKGVTPTHPHT